MPVPALKLFFDGGCRPNPGTMETAVVVRGKVHHRANIGQGTNNDAEWRALLHALEVARDLGAKDVILLGDSAFVLAQASGKARPRRAYAAYLAQFTAAAAHFERLRLRKVPRAQNLAGIALEAVKATAPAA